jgi:putative ABC transport system ATP-binding protein
VILDVRDVVKEYRPVGGELLRAVDHVSLAVDRGELVALYGPSGSGKTTLLKLIAALERSQHGQVLVEGRDVALLRDRPLAEYWLRGLGIVMQTFHMIGGLSAIENAALKLMRCGLTHREAAQRLEPLFDRLGLSDRAGHQATQLSMGERQRVALARALSTEPPLLLADEPTGNLDTDRGADVLQLLRDVAREQGAAVLLVTHDPQAATVADRVLALRDGRLATDGLPSAVAPPT